MRLLLSLCATMLVLATSASGAAPSALRLGVLGNVARFKAQTGQDSQVHQAIVGWNQGLTWGAPLPDLLAQHVPIPLIGITTDTKPLRREAITPAAIAAGRGDAYLVAWNKAIADWGQLVYIRPMPEMDGYWTLYSAYTKGGKRKNPAHSTRAFRMAFARIYVVLHGGSRAQLDARLKRLALPLLQGDGDLPVNPPERLRVIWNPQGYPVPDIPANRPQAYYPGDAYVDVVGNDVYDFNHRPAWPENDRFYLQHPAKPYAFPEWGVWGSDNPEFVRTMARFVRTHRRVELLVYNAGKPGSPSDLGSRPKSRAAYRAAITPLGG
jgi:hypothetical protein